MPSITYFGLKGERRRSGRAGFYNGNLAIPAETLA
jgi:hypothetical protein